MVNFVMKLYSKSKLLLNFIYVVNCMVDVTFRSKFQSLYQNNCTRTFYALSREKKNLLYFYFALKLARERFLHDGFKYIAPILMNSWDSS